MKLLLLSLMLTGCVTSSSPVGPYSKGLHIDMMGACVEMCGVEQVKSYTPRSGICTCKEGN